MSFNSAFNYDFDASNGIDANKLDFEGLVAHHIGHLLGFVSEITEQDSPAIKPGFATSWDMFRFQADRTPGGFTAAHRIPANTKQAFFTSSNNALVANGRFLSKVTDKESASHWKTNPLGQDYLGVMEPRLSFGQRLTITKN